MEINQSYLRAILATVARQTFPPHALYEIITSGRSGSEKQVAAYNLCDGTNSQTEIAKATGLDVSNFSKSLARWIEAGIVIRVGEGRSAIPLHVYPISESLTPKGK